MRTLELVDAKAVYVYVAPDVDAVIVRSGRDWGEEHEAWLVAFREIADRLVGGA